MSLPFWMFWVLFVLTLLPIAVVWIYKKRYKDESLCIATVIEFLICAAMGAVLYIKEGGDSFLYSIPTSIVKAIGTASGNGYDNAADIASDIVVQSADKAQDSFLCFSNSYEAYDFIRAIAAILLVFFFSRTIISFFEERILEKWLFRLRKRPVFIFSACNDKTVAIAESILEDNEKKHSEILFIGSKKELSQEQYARIGETRCRFINRGISSVIEKRRKCKIEVFLFNNVETENLIELGEIGEGLKKHNVKEVTLFIELINTPWDICDGYGEKLRSRGNKKGIVKTNFIRSEESFVYNNLLRNSIFDNVIETKEGDETLRIINVLIVGYNNRAIEMLKAVLWLGQMPEHEIHVVMIDEKDHSRILKQEMPEIEINKPVNRPGDAVYTFEYKNCADYDSCSVEEIIKTQMPDMTFGFVCAGDDLENIKIASRINAFMLRNGREGSYILQANVDNKSLKQYLDTDLMEYIQFVGEDTYSYKVITASEIESLSKAIHEIRYDTKKEPDKAWDIYYSNEYNRHSVYARTLSVFHKITIMDRYYNSNYNFSAEKWPEYEHIRWNVYTRTNGYSKTPASNEYVYRGLREAAKYHKDLLPFLELPESERIKDDIKINIKDEGGKNTSLLMEGIKTEIDKRRTNTRRTDKRSACLLNDRLFVYDDLWKTSIFKEAQKNENSGDDKIINALIIGYNDLNLEMAKAILWLGQMPGYEVTVSIIDVEDNQAACMETMPEIQVNKECLNEQQGVYTFKYEPDINMIWDDKKSEKERDEVTREKVRKKKDMLRKATFIFVHTGYDKSTKDIVKSIDKAFKEEPLSATRQLVLSHDKNETTPKGWQVLIKQKNKPYEEKDPEKDIEKYEFVRVTKEIHMEKQTDDQKSEELEKKREELEKKWDDQMKNDYIRFSKFARTLGYRYKKSEIKSQYSGSDINNILSEDLWRLYEHRRWCVFTRTMGYKYDPKSKGRDEKNMTHNDLVDFEKLQRSEKEKDSMKLSKKIIEML